METIAPICYGCKHFEKGRINNVPQIPFYCTAYPMGIPDEIMYQGFDHRLPFPEDKGIRFMLDPKKKREHKFYLKDKKLMGL